MIKTKRFLALLCAAFILSTSIVLPVSSAGDINVSYSLSQPSGTVAWYPVDANSHFKWSKDLYNVSYVDSGLYGITMVPDYFDSFYEDRLSVGITSHQWCSLLFEIAPNINLSGLDLNDYNLVLDWSFNVDPSDDVADDMFTENLSTLTSSLGLNSSQLSKVGGGVPRVDSFSGSSLPHTGTLFKVSGKTFSDTYVFTEPSDILSILDGSFIFGLPYNVDTCSNSLSLSLDMTLVYTGAAPDFPDIPDEPNTDVPNVPSSSFGFTSPEVYDYDVTYYFSPTSNGQVKDGYEVTDFYLKNGSIRFKDSTDSIFTVSWPWNEYSLYYSFTYADGVSNSDFSDTIFRTYTVKLQSQVDSDLIYAGADFSKYAFRTHFYIDVSDSPNFDYVQYKSYVEKASSSFYGFDPFSIKVGSVVIPFEYWKLEFNSTSSCIRATLELDGSDETQRSFIRALATNGQDVSINFTLGNDTTFLFGTGTYSNGFWKKYVDDPIVPDEPQNVITEKDLEAAFNKGYHQGAADNGGTNYVFAFVNGLWSGLGEFFSIVTNGITLGHIGDIVPITLGNVLYSIILIVVVFVIIK